MPLYHFTAAHMLRPILEQGLTIGATPARLGGRMVLVTGTQWLTTDKSFEQDWCAPAYSSLPYDRNAYRLTIEIPNAQRSHTFTWDEFYNVHMKPNGLAKIPHFDDRKHCNPDAWRVFVGHIHPLWIKTFDENKGGYRSCSAEKIPAMLSPSPQNKAVGDH